MTQDEIRKIFDYDATTGNLIRRSSNKVTGTPDVLGYKKTKFKGTTKNCHRIVYTWHYGEIPENHHIDHIDHDRSNNRIENLQCLKAYDNCIKKIPQNDYNRKGYTVYKTNKGWCAKLIIRLGPCNTEQEIVEECNKVQKSVVTELP